MSVCSVYTYTVMFMRRGARAQHNHTPVLIEVRVQHHWLRHRSYDCA